MLRSSSRFRGNVLHLLHRGTPSSPQDIDSSVDVSIVVRTTFRTGPLPIRKRKVFVVMPTIRTRFCGRSPLSSLKELTIMFQTLILQYLNKLSKGKVGDFASPETLHTSKVEFLCRNRVKPSAQVCSKFPMPIFALVGDMPIASRELTKTTPPIVRPDNFTTQCLVKRPKGFQGLFQEFWRLYLLACGKC